MRYRFILLRLGCALISASALARFGFGYGNGIGRLVPKEALVVWRSPKSSKLSDSKVQEAVFDLTNPGGTTVGMTGMHTGRGCAKPTVEPSVVLPGGTCRVSVAGSPFSVGEKSVPITLRTDSTATGFVIDLIHQGTGPILQAQNGLASLAGRWGSARSLLLAYQIVGKHLSQLQIFVSSR